MSAVKDSRVVFLGLAVFCAALAGAASCSAPDPGSITYSERPSGTGGDTNSSSSSSSSSSGGAVSTDGGSTALADAIFGTTTFAYQDPGVLANNQNGAHNGTVVGKDCAVNSGCHGTGSTKPWTFCGTLYAADKKTTIAQGEVKVVGPDGGAIGSAYTDANGNFWYEGDPLPANSKVGARASGVTAAQHMSTALLATNSGCNSATSNCHGTAGQGFVHVP